VGRALSGVQRILDKALTSIYDVDKYLHGVWAMDLEELLIQTLNREAARYQVPPDFKRDLEEALMELEMTPSISLSRETIENRKQDILRFWHLAGQPVF
jgi:hypothetical protein